MSNKISKLLANIYWILSILFCPFIYIKFLFTKLFHPRTKYKDITGGITLLLCESKEEVDTQFAIYRIPDKNFSATLYRKIKGLTYFMVRMSYEQYLDVRLNVIKDLVATKIDYKNKKISLPQNLFKQ